MSLWQSNDDCKPNASDRALERRGSLINDFSFGYRVFKSRMLSRLLGALLMLGSFGYLIGIVGALIAPGYAESPHAEYAGIPASLGEIGIRLWLLVRGAHEPKNLKLE